MRGNPQPYIDMLETTALQQAEPAPATELFESYDQLTRALLEAVTGVCLLNSRLSADGESGDLHSQTILTALTRLNSNDQPWRAVCFEQGVSRRLTVLPLYDSGTLLGALCIQQSAGPVRASPSQHLAVLEHRLRPALNCLQRELTLTLPEARRLQSSDERTAELEWLSDLTAGLPAEAGDRRAVESLLRAASERLECGLAVLSVPEKRLRIDFLRDPSCREVLVKSWLQTSKHLHTWAERQNRPLLVNGTPVARERSGAGGTCKILSVPLVRDTGRVIGVLAFFKTADRADFNSKQLYLARHLARKATLLSEAHFDTMTGLYTPAGLEQVYGEFDSERGAREGSVLYLDIDRLDIVNELHGFELGNEVIVRSAELLAPPLLPFDALSARLSADRFAVILPNVTPEEAVKFAQQVQRAAAELRLGPSEAAVDLSLSCGVAILVDMPQGLARALAAAEIACKKAKANGRSRVELYSCEDASIMRRNDDIAAVGEIRAAFREDRLLLFAQKIVPLRDSGRADNYEILMRLRGGDGELISPGPLISAAQRYQLLPVIDRRVMERALQQLAPFRRVLMDTGVTFSVNVTGQSFCDADYINQFTQRLRDSHLPVGCITIEVTEQAALTNLARATEMAGRLRTLGCSIAIDDFGTGSNSLSNLKSLQISRVKIDGSFVRDLLTDRRSHSIVSAIVHLAKSYGIETVAEYVETVEVADRLRSLGVDYAQGFAFGRPEPLEAILNRLGHEESQRLHQLFMEN